MIPLIKIKPDSTKHSLFITLIGVVMLLICLVLINSFWLDAKLILIFITLASMVVFITGVTKKIEPKCSFEITPQTLKYMHRCGHWCLPWEDINYIAVLSTTQGINQQYLPYIGIRLGNIERLQNYISPRLANKLIHEQRALLILAVQYNLISVDQMSMRFKPYKAKTGLVSGPIGEFLYHCESLKMAFGFDLVIPSTALDREVNEFCKLLNDCKESTRHYQV